MDWTSQDDIEGECAPTQLVPASQACDLAEESALEFNPDRSQDAWGAPESLDAWSAPSPSSGPDVSITVRTVSGDLASGTNNIPTYIIIPMVIHYYLFVIMYF